MSSSINSQRTVKFGQRIEKPSLQLEKTSLEKPSIHDDISKKKIDLFLSTTSKSACMPEARTIEDTKSDTAKPGHSGFKFDKLSLNNEKQLKTSERLLEGLLKQPIIDLKNQQKPENSSLSAPKPSLDLKILLDKNTELKPIDVKPLFITDKHSQGLAHPDYSASENIKPGIDLKKLLDTKKEEDRKKSSPIGVVSNLFKKVSRFIPSPTRITVVRDLRNEPEESKLNYAPIPFEELFPGGNTTFRQREVGNCGVLSACYGILQHPELLQSIRFEATRYPGSNEIRAYQVTFPSGLSAEFDADDVGQPEDGMRPVDGPLGIQLLERAYAIVTREARNASQPTPYPNSGRGHTLQLTQARFTPEVLRDLFGKTSCREEIFIADNNSPTQPMNHSPSTVAKLIEQLTRIASDSQHTYILAAYTPERLPESEPDRNVITITRDDGSTFSLDRQHALVIKSFDLASQAISLVNPHNTENVITLSLNEFCRAFTVLHGMKLAKQSDEQQIAA